MVGAWPMNDPWGDGAAMQVASHGDAMRDAGVVGGVTSLLSDPHEPVAIAAAEALRHLACANQQNREAAREGGAIPLLIAMLQRVAEAMGAPALCARVDAGAQCAGGGRGGGGGGGGGGAEAEVEAGGGGGGAEAAPHEAYVRGRSPHDSRAASLVTAATAALRNLSFQARAHAPQHAHCTHTACTLHAHCMHAHAHVTCTCTCTCTSCPCTCTCNMHIHDTCM
jgi:hypothetical protein